MVTARSRKKFRRKLFAGKNSFCWYCGGKMKYKNATLDHQNPIARFNNNRHDNLVLSCKDCNQEKANKTVEEYRQKLQLERKKNIIFFGEK